MVELCMTRAHAVNDTIKKIFFIFLIFLNVAKECLSYRQRPEVGLILSTKIHHQTIIRQPQSQIKLLPRVDYMQHRCSFISVPPAFKTASVLVIIESSIMNPI